MTTLDPSRYKFAVLANPSDRLPLPDRGGRLFMASGEYVDTYNSAYVALLADGSLKLASGAAALAPSPAIYTQAQLDAAVAAAAASLQAQIAALQAQIASGTSGSTTPANGNTLRATYAAFGLLGAVTN